MLKHKPVVIMFYGAIWYQATMSLSSYSFKLINQILSSLLKTFLFRIF